jgi:hypothetical protein
VTDDVWSTPGTDARRELTAARLTELDAWRSRNQSKAQVLAVGMGLQVAAVLFTAAAVMMMLAGL